MVNQYSVDYHTSLSGLTSRIHPHISQTCISHHGWVKFSNLQCIHSCPSQAKISPRLSSPPRQWKITHFPRQGFLENLFPSKKGGGIYVSRKLKNFVLYFGILHQKKASNNYERCFLFYQKSSFCTTDIQSFAISSSPVNHFWIHRRGWLKIKPKVYAS